MQRLPAWQTLEDLALLVMKQGKKCLYGSVAYGFWISTIRAVDLWDLLHLGWPNIKVPTIDQSASRKWLLKELCIGLVRVAELFLRNNRTRTLWKKPGHSDNKAKMDTAGDRNRGGDGDRKWQADKPDSTILPGIRGVPTPHPTLTCCSRSLASGQLSVSAREERPKGNSRLPKVCPGVHPSGPWSATLSLANHFSHLMPSLCPPPRWSLLTFQPIFLKVDTT